MLVRHLEKLFFIDLSQAPFWQRLFFYASLVVLVVSIGVSATDLYRYEGCDFLTRYAEARCGFFDLDPYKTMADWMVNGVSQEKHEAYFKGVPHMTNIAGITPGLILVYYMPLALLDYISARYMSGILEWIAFLASIILLTRVVERNADRIVAVSTSLFFFAGSSFWRLHVERGQYYIFTVLLIASALFVLHRKKKDFLSGLLLGITISIRPTALFIALPFVLQRRWKMLSGALCSGVIIGVLSLCVFGLTGWKSFFWMTNKYELLSTDFSSNVFADISRVPEPPPIQDFEKSGKCGAAALPSINSTAVGIIRITKPILTKYSISVSSILLFAKSGVLFATLAMIWFFVPARRSSRNLCSPDDYLFYVGIAAVNLIEYVIPIRAAYADIYYLLFVMLGIPIVARQKSTWLGVLLLIALASQQNLLGLVHGWYSIPVRVVGLTLFSFGVLYCWHDRSSSLHSSTETNSTI